MKSAFGSKSNSFLNSAMIFLKLKTIYWSWESKYHLSWLFRFWSLKWILNIRWMKQYNFSLPMDIGELLFVGYHNRVLENLISKYVMPHWLLWYWHLLQQFVAWKFLQRNQFNYVRNVYLRFAKLSLLS